MVMVDTLLMNCPANIIPSYLLNPLLHTVRKRNALQRLTLNGLTPKVTIFLCVVFIRLTSSKTFTLTHPNLELF